MRALLDTHTFIWWIMDDPKLPSYVRSIISDGDNELFFSAASCWEIAIKAQIGRIKLPSRPDIFISEQLALNAVQTLPIQVSHALHVFNLPRLHRDPFDRMIIAQSQLEDLLVLTLDPLIAKYKIKTIWKEAE
ncbi:MAG: type II toxin-antitoxin system VapC family toxin [Nitrospirota bacterium]